VYHQRMKRESEETLGHGFLPRSDEDNQRAHGAMRSPELADQLPSQADLARRGRDLR
jgi:hypothetical protein